MDRIEEIKIDYGTLKLDYNRHVPRCMVLSAARTLLQEIHDDIEALVFDFEDVESLTNGLRGLVMAIVDEQNQTDDYFKNFGD